MIILITRIAKITNNSIKPTDTRVNEWYLAEIPRVFPQISLSREKMSEILRVKRGFQTFSPKTVRFEGTRGGISKPNVKSEL